MSSNAPAPESFSEGYEAPEKSRAARLLVLVVLLAVLATMGIQISQTSGPSLSLTTGTTTTTTDQPWYEGRTWAGEIDVCVEAINDISGCQWLAGLLIHRGCELKVYQTFASVLFMGGDFEAVYDDAVTQGDCPNPSRSGAQVSDVRTSHTPKSAMRQHSGVGSRLGRPAS